MLLWPLSIFGIERRLTSCDIGIGWMDPWGSLEDLPEAIENEEDGNAKIGSEEVGDAPVRVVFAYKDIKSVEDDDDGKVGKGKPSSVWLES